MHATPIVDRDYFRSIYFRDPNGYVVELTAKREGHDAEMAPDPFVRTRSLAEPVPHPRPPGIEPTDQLGERSPFQLDPTIRPGKELGERAREDDDRRPPRMERRERGGAYGTLAIRVTPREAEVSVDGDRWELDSDGRLDVQVAAGPEDATHFPQAARPVGQVSQPE